MNATEALAARRVMIRLLRDSLGGASDVTDLLTAYGVCEFRELAHVVSIFTAEMHGAFALQCGDDLAAIRNAIDTLSDMIELDSWNTDTPE